MRVLARFADGANLFLGSIHLLTQLALVCPEFASAVLTLLVEVGTTFLVVVLV